MPHLPVSARTFTPDREEITADGRTVTHLHLKRCCNGCGVALGDIEDRDVDDNGNLTDVRGECPNCAPLVALEAAGCRTWQLTPRNIARVDDEIDRDGIYAKGYWQTVDGKLQVVGLRIGTDHSRQPRVVAYFGDWIIRNPDGRWSVHAGPKADA
jgi:hypothetical protein